MDYQQWEMSFLDNLISGQELPFDFPLSSHKGSDYLDVEIDLSNDTDQNRLTSAFLLLLKSYSNKSNILFGMKYKNNPIRPDTLDFSFIDTTKTLSISVEKIISNSVQSYGMSLDEVNTKFKAEILSLGLPVYQCGMGIVDNKDDIPSIGYLNFYLSGGDTVGIRYDKKLFRHETVNRILLSWINIFNQVISDPIDIIFIDSISNTCRKTLLSNWNKNNNQSPIFEGVHAAFEHHVDNNSNAPCISDDLSSYNYQETENEANHIANTLIDEGIKPGELIGVALPRNIQLLTSVIGIFKAGAAYVPLDPDFPDDRLQYMAEHSQCRILITSQELASRFNYFSGTILTIESIKGLSIQKVSRPRVRAKLENTAYVIYTSGSTGKPKGVEITQGNVINLLQSMAKTPGMNKQDVLCAITTLSFDISVLELFLPIYTGASLIIVKKDISLFSDKLATVLKKYRVSILQATPATFRLLIANDWQPSSPIKILCGGEPFPKDLATDLLSRVSEVWNVYGPTETTVWSTVYQVKSDSNTILIGRPVDNTSIYILDDFMRLTPIGMPGNLYIGGAGLAKGYLHREDLTRERFIENPLAPGKIYHTGDIAKYTSTGEIECLGRSDGQVKIRGYRIELGEIENAISKYDDISSQVVIVREDQPGDLRLAAYYLAKTGMPIDQEHLKSILQKTLPNYMIPTSFVHMSEFPMTLNYKIDRNKLPKPKKTPDSPILNTVKTQTEHELHKIWCSILDLDKIDITVSFFDIGGNSLLSVKVFTAIKNKFDLDLQLDSLFKFTSINKLALEIDRLKILGSETLENKESSANLITIKDTGSGLPVFFFHGVGGNVLNYIRLVSSIESNRTIYGLQSSGVDGRSDFSNDYEKMLNDYIEQIKQIQPKGPYTFAGGSMGGTTAIDIASKLEQEKDNSVYVIMFDSFGPNFDFDKYGKDSSSISLHLRIINSLNYRFVSIKTKCVQTLCKLLSLPLPHSIRYQLIEANNYRLLAMRQPRQFHGDATLIRAPIQMNGCYADPNLGWTDYITGSLDIHYVEGTHTNIVESKESIDIFSEILNNKEILKNIS